ncbi:hypothetical protein BN938_1653 [Mucinivorans hirudinis]|uniref:Uncharacterized protein n=1 Tax=Mucinivorans hirudinis TaxID=1433126 RepID=A0A060RCY0_9BACT|nr:hypothetical protein BN938_1653 [Mucinivorans hirudinis]
MRQPQNVAIKKQRYIFFSEFQINFLGERWGYWDFEGF